MMEHTISAARFRLLCREIASKVNARRNREETTRAAVLLELLRRVEGHLGRKPGDLAGSAADPTRGIMEALDRLVDASADAAWVAIAETELLCKVRLREDAVNRP